MRGFVRRGKRTQPSLASPPRGAFELWGQLGKRCLHAFGRHWQLSYAASGRVSEGVGQCRRSGRKRTFAGSQRRIAPIHQNDFDAGDLRKPKYGIPRPVPARDLPSVEGNLLLQSETDRLDDTSLELIPRSVRIDDESDIGRYHNSGDLDDAGLAVDLHIHHYGSIHPDALVSAKGQAASIAAIALLPWNPARFVRSSLKHSLRSWIPEMSKTERQRVDASGVGELVHEGLDRENVSVSSQCSERSVSYRRVEEQVVSDLLPRQFVGRYRICGLRRRTAEECAEEET